jgi:O-acetyl-ADP-ribose deacetylase (regulator of RNase III)
MNTKITLIKGDITRMDVDAIVNAANNGLMGGGGVDGAIHRAGGPVIATECKAIRDAQGGCKTGQAVITSGGNLLARYVIHTVGPVWEGGNRDEGILLADAYRNSLQLAIDHGLETVAFPNISTGVYGFPKKEASRIAVETVRAFAAAHENFDEIFFVCYDDENYNLYKALL